MEQKFPVRNFKNLNIARKVVLFPEIYGKCFSIHHWNFPETCQEISAPFPTCFESVNRKVEWKMLRMQVHQGCQKSCDLNFVFLITMFTSMESNILLGLRPMLIGKMKIK